MSVTHLPSTEAKTAEPGLTVTVYSKPDCPQCEATYRALKKHGLDFEVVDLSQEAEALERVKAMGFQQAPVVEIDGLVRDTWCGFRPDRVKATLKALTEHGASAPHRAAA